MNEVAGAELLISTIAICLPSGYQDSGGVATGLEARPVVWNTVVRSTIFCDTVLAAINRWWLTTVYGPTQRAEKESFLAEIASIAIACQGVCLICGDFNLIYQATDKITTGYIGD